MGQVAILLLAAGASSRMRGADKLLQNIDAEPLLRRQAVAMRLTGHPVIVALPLDHLPRKTALSGLDVAIVEVADAAQGMSASIKAGVLAAADASGLAILPADMPEITTQDMNDMLAAFMAQDQDRVVRATALDGTVGHPVIFPRRLFPALLRLTGDAGARAALTGEQVVAIALPDRHALVDLDTPQDWATWQTVRDDKNT